MCTAPSIISHTYITENLTERKNLIKYNLANATLMKKYFIEIVQFCQQ